MSLNQQPQLVGSEMMTMKTSRFESQDQKAGNRPGVEHGTRGSENSKPADDQTQSRWIPGGIGRRASAAKCARVPSPHDKTIQNWNLWSHFEDD